MTYARTAALGIMLGLIIMLGLLGLAAYAITGLPIMAVW